MWRDSQRKGLESRVKMTKHLHNCRKTRMRLKSLGIRFRSAWQDSWWSCRELPEAPLHYFCSQITRDVLNFAHAILFQPSEQTSEVLSLNPTNLRRWSLRPVTCPKSTHRRTKEELSGLDTLLGRPIPVWATMDQWDSPACSPVLTTHQNTSQTLLSSWAYRGKGRTKNTDPNHQEGKFTMSTEASKNRIILCDFAEIYWLAHRVTPGNRAHNKWKEYLWFKVEKCIQFPKQRREQCLFSLEAFFFPFFSRLSSTGSIYSRMIPKSQKTGLLPETSLDNLNSLRLAWPTFSYWWPCIFTKSDNQ